MSKPWGAIGAWALDTERAEAEEKELAALASSSATLSTIFAGEPLQSFPTPKEAATKPNKKKKKGITVTLSQLSTGSYVGPGGALRETSFEPKGLTTEEMLRLPTGPRERTQEELDNSRIGGGFRSYGYGGGGAPRRMNDEMGRGPPPSRASDLDQPSRADGVDNWASAKKPYAQAMDSGRQDRYSSLGSVGSSRADEVDNWALGKKSVAPLSRHSGFVSGFRDSSGSGMNSDRWGRGGGSFSVNGDRERPRLVLDPPKRNSEPQPEPARTRPSPFSSARPREEVLAEKGLDWRKMEAEIEMKKAGGLKSSHSSRPTSAQSSRPETPGSQVSGEGDTSKPRTKVNPFGDAKPREVILEEKGKDWRKIDQELEHRRVDRLETDDEKILKEEISRLKEELGKITEGNMNGDSSHLPSEQHDSLLEQIRKREKDLDDLMCELDDKVRFSQKSFLDARSGSGSGRPSSADKSSVKSGLSENSRSVEFADRPRSRGKGDSWGRQMNEKRGFQSSRDSSFRASWGMDRSKSRERW